MRTACQAKARCTPSLTCIDEAVATQILLFCLLLIAVTAVILLVKDKNGSLKASGKLTSGGRGAFPLEVSQACEQPLVEHVVDGGVADHDQAGQHALPQTLQTRNECLKYCRRLQWEDSHTHTHAFCLQAEAGISAQLHAQSCMQACYWVFELCFE